MIMHRPLHDDNFDFNQDKAEFVRKCEEAAKSFVIPDSVSKPGTKKYARYQEWLKERNKDK